MYIKTKKNNQNKNTTQTIDIPDTYRISSGHRRDTVDLHSGRPPVRLGPCSLLAFALGMSVLARREDSKAIRRSSFERHASMPCALVFASGGAMSVAQLGACFCPRGRYVGGSARRFRFSVGGARPWGLGRRTRAGARAQRTPQHGPPPAWPAARAKRRPRRVQQRVVRVHRPAVSALPPEIVLYAIGFLERPMQVPRRGGAHATSRPGVDPRPDSSTGPSIDRPKHRPQTYGPRLAPQTASRPTPDRPRVRRGLAPRGGCKPPHCRGGGG